MVRLLIIPIAFVPWCLGGQGILWARRYAIPIISALYGILDQKRKDKRWYSLIFLLFIGILSLGYGENSVLKKICRRSETWTRVVMAVLISLVFICYAIFVGSRIWSIPVILVLNISAWQIKAGSLGKVFGKDILIEDIVRATAFSISLLIV